MRDAFLALLRCPFCGTCLAPVENHALARTADAISSGVLGCECCAFPVVDGIPVLIADDTSRAAIADLEAGRLDQARERLLGLEPERVAPFRALLARGSEATYREFIAVLSPDAEGTYFVYRFSDPTFVMADGVLRGLAQNPAATGRWVIDVCGGSGHLTRTLIQMQQAAISGGPGVVLADMFFAKLWLAARITAPSCHPVCCNGNDPLPFDRDAFSMAVLSDAFPYIWHKRLLAEELMRLTGPGGLVVMPHLHSALGENFSPGMPLTPAAYAALFAPLGPRLFRDRDLLAPILDREGFDLTQSMTPDAIGDEPSLTLIASGDASVFREYQVPGGADVAGSLIVNPLYQVSRRPGGSTLTLTFPTLEYADEFGGCRRYLPDSLEVCADLTGVLDPATLAVALGGEFARLRRARVLIDVPRRYC
ncbi:MAG: hypothetical protein ABI880_02545 [Acidobacteriota bacterium]